MRDLLDNLRIAHYSEQRGSKQNAKQHIGDEQRLMREQCYRGNHGSTGEYHKKSKQNRIMQHDGLVPTLLGNRYIFTSLAGEFYRIHTG